jgi:acetyl-CoA C-acetyltransferase
MPHVASIGRAGRRHDAVLHRREPDLTRPATVRAARCAFAVVDDFITGIGLIGYEDVGFVERFGGRTLAHTDVTSVGGTQPVRTAASGVVQCVELLGGLYGEAVKQVDSARNALVHNVGAATAVSAVTSLEGAADGAW